MKKQDVIEFFDKCATNWDAEMIRSDVRINKILDYAEVSEGKRVLDVACGTGVLIPDYLARKVGKIVGVDISPKMIEIAKGKFSSPLINFICADVEECCFETPFDVCVVYNAFPHFESPGRLIANLAVKLKENGRLTVAHGMSREEINARHSKSASFISNELMECDELKKLFDSHFKVDVCVSNDEIYVVSGTKRGEN